MTERSLRDVGKGLLGQQFHDLGLRAISGSVLALVAIVMTYAGGLAFMTLIAVVVVLMSWEWGRIVRGAGIDSAGLVHAVAVAAATMLAAASQIGLAALLLVVGTIIVLPLSFGVSALLSCLGVLYVGLPAVALISLRGDQTHGLLAVMLVMLVVWTVDTAAFLGGRSIGGPRLWPAISPNKTWAGFICGVGAGVLMGIALAFWIGAPLLHLAVVSLLLGAGSQAGDLAESALKRAFGVKDSSGLIPGHGGILDRVDGIVTAATLAGIIGLVSNFTAPARGLLFGS